MKKRQKSYLFIVIVPALRDTVFDESEEFQHIPHNFYVVTKYKLCGTFLVCCKKKKKKLLKEKDKAFSK